MNPNPDSGLPANIDAEKTILGAVMLDNAAYEEAAGTLSADEFFLDSHRRIFRRMGDLMEARRPIDIVTLSAELERNYETLSVGGVAYLAGLTEGLPRRPVIGEYIRIVKDKALARRVMFISAAAQARAAEQSQTAVEVIEAMQAQIDEARESIPRKGSELVDKLPDEAFHFEQEINAQPSELLGAHLLTPNIDALTSGLMADELCLVAGRPGSGKTEAGLQIALNNARRGKRVYIQSLEMKSRQLIRRMWRVMAKVPVANMRDPRCLNPDERLRIRLAQDEMADLPIFVDDTHELTISEYRSRAVLAAKRWKADLLVVDYAQLLIVPKARNIIEAAPKQAETLRHVARDYCRTVALAQIRRAPPNDLNRYPDIEDILGSSAFEQAAQVILMLHRTREDRKYTGEDYCILGKMRELQELRNFGIRAEKWGAFVDRYEGGN